MRIAVLTCGAPPPVLASSFGDYPTMFERFFAAHGQALQLTPFDVTVGDLPAAGDDFDGLLSTGSAASVYEPLPWISPLQDFVRDAHARRVRHVGICFGHQLLASSLGGRVVQAEAGWGIGAHEVTLTATEPWMQPAQPTYTLLVSHQDQVVDLPPGGRVLGGTPHCPIAMLTIDDHALGIQAHPEFRPDYAGALMRSRRNTIGTELVSQAEPTLRLPLDDSVVARWIGAFLLTR